MKEEAVQFGDAGSLVGIVTSSAEGTANKPAVILLNPGIVHRVGPGRIYVKIARALAARGLTVLRFDFSTIGDSTARLDNCCFDKSSVDETRTAMSFLQTTRGISRFILLGGCSGAEVCLTTSRFDPRAFAAILINFPAKADEPEGSSHRIDGHYYWTFALFSLKSWRKLLAGQSNYRKIGRALLHGLRQKFIDRSGPSVPEQHFRATLWELVNRGVQLTFICSKGDVLLKDLREAGGKDLKQLCGQGKIACEVIAGTDHTFSSLYDHEGLVDAVVKHVDAAALVPKKELHAPEVSSRALEAVL